MALNVTYTIINQLESARNLYTYLLCPLCQERFLVQVGWLQTLIRDKGEHEIHCPNGCRFTICGDLKVGNSI